MFFHLYKRGQTYYFRLRIPHDISHHFPNPEVKKSLKTKNLPAAKVLCSSWEEKFQKAFALLRSGYIREDQIHSIIDELLPEKTGSLKTSSFSGLIDIYINDKSSKWSARTKTEFSHHLFVLLSLMGDKPIASFSRSDCLSCRNQLQALPPHFTKKKQYREMSPKQIAEANDSGKHLNSSTVNQYLALLSTFFKWAIRQQIITNNPAEGLLLSVKHSASEEREVYSVEDLQRIQAKLPPSEDEPEKHWIPRIAMYSGLRMDEICQLHREDIHAIDGHLCFDINAKGEKKLKTGNSARIVPVHSKLIELGLLDYVQSVKSDHLWPNIEPDKYGRWGRKFGNWYSRFNRKEITDNPKKCFHSFRHTVANHLKQSGINETVIAELIGHKNESITTGRYGKSYNVAVLSEAIAALTY